MYRAGLLQNFLVNMVGPVGSDRRDYESLEFYITEDEGLMHGKASGGGRFAVKVPGGGEVVEGGF